MKNLRIIFILLLTVQFNNYSQTNIRSVYIDKTGTIRWTDDKSEVSLFGANYCLPSACDYRAAKMVTSDLKKVIDQDMAHFARMGWDGLRLSFWGDFENSDREGNLVVNEHLDLLDYLIFKAKERQIYMMFSPIVTYSALWPDAMDDTASINGFSKFFKKEELGTNPKAIEVQCNYIMQFLNHINPYTGIAIKDEPSIPFFELINEPAHHSDDFDGSVKYINALVDAIKSTSCQKLLFHNLSQDMRMDKAIKASKVDGASFAWYPCGLVSGRSITSNLLRTVDDYTPMHTADLGNKAKVVYEFDEADSYTPYMYPAMARSYRAVGAQFAAMFSYDMLATAPFNLGWQTHALNMIYYPNKAIGAIIAAEVMRLLPRFENYGPYPDNCKFGPFRVSYEEQLSEMVIKDKFFYANSTTTIIKDVSTLKKIVGYGLSTIVKYDGFGLYFLDKIKEGVWRLEIYPDAIVVNDPFAQMSIDKRVVRLISNQWSMEVNLPDLLPEFKIQPLNEGNTYSTIAKNNAFKISPGVYILSNNVIDKKTLPEKNANINMTEFVCPYENQLPVNVVIHASEEYVKGKELKISADVIDVQKPQEVSLYLRDRKYNGPFRKVPMVFTNRYNYQAVVPAKRLPVGLFEYCIEVKMRDTITVFPMLSHKSVASWDFFEKSPLSFRIVEEKSPVRLFLPCKDIEKLAFTRIGDGIRHGIYDIIASANNGETALRLYFPNNLDSALQDYTLSLEVKNRINERKTDLGEAKGLKIFARSYNVLNEAFVTLIEAEGTSWCKNIALSDQWSEITIPWNEFSVSKGVKLPLGYPEQWNYWITPAKDRGGSADNIQVNKIERLQISLRPNQGIKLENAAIEISSVAVYF